MGLKVIQPLYDRIVVKLVEQEAEMVGSIIVPDIAVERPQFARVVAVGRGHRSKNGTLTPLCVRIGDRVLLGKYSGNDVSIEGHTYVVLREQEVIGIVEDYDANPIDALAQIYREATSIIGFVTAERIKQLAEPALRDAGRIE